MIAFLSIAFLIRKDKNEQKINEEGRVKFSLLLAVIFVLVAFFVLK